MSEFGLDSKIAIDDTINGQDIHDLKSYITDKNYPYVNDQQNGSYSNQTSYDLSALVSNDAYLNNSNSYLTSPMSISMNSSAAWGTASIPPSAISLKSNYINFIDSVQLYVNNKQMIDQTTMMNLPVSVLGKLEMSYSDLKLEGKGQAIWPDTYSAATYSSSATDLGDGFLNNNVSTGSATSAIVNTKVNKGLVERQSMFVNCSAVDTASQTIPTIGATAAARAAKCQEQGLPYFTSGTTANQAAAWNFILYIPLNRLHDVFRRMPLIKNSQVRLVINWNLGKVVLTNGAGPVVSLASSTLTAGNTIPFMFNPKTSTATTPTSGTTTISVNIQASTTAPTDNGAAGAIYGYPLLPQSRIYCQSLKIAPNYEEKILANRVKTIRYLDWFQYPFTAVAGAAYSQTISTSLPNVAVAVILPYQAQSSTIFASATGVAQYQSPFDAAPEQTLPLGFSAFKQLNCQVNGTNVFNNNMQFTYDNYVQEVKSLALNGALKRELASGLMDLVDWQFSPVAIIDLGDRVDAEADAYQSVVISGTNGCAVNVDYKVFIGYWKTYTIDVLTGQVEKIF